MPKLIHLYIRNVVAGFALSAVFVPALLYFNIANLWHLVSTSSMGWVAVTMLFVFHGLVFAGVQFAIVIMRMGEKDDPDGGKRDPLAIRMQSRESMVAIPVRVDDKR
jgi:hypothetical protein